MPNITTSILLCNIDFVFLKGISCLHRVASVQANKGQTSNFRRSGYHNMKSSLPATLSKAEVVFVQKCGRDEAIPIEEGIKHLITSPGFPDMYPKKALYV